MPTRCAEEVEWSEGTTSNIVSFEMHKLDHFTRSPPLPPPVILERFSQLPEGLSCTLKSFSHFISVADIMKLSLSFISPFIGRCRRKTTRGNCCVFPFTYRRRRYNNCAKNRRGQSWCYITPDKKRWGYCRVGRKRTFTSLLITLVSWFLVYFLVCWLFSVLLCLFICLFGCCLVVWRYFTVCFVDSPFCLFSFYFLICFFRLSTCLFVFVSCCFISHL